MASQIEFKKSLFIFTFRKLGKTISLQYPAETRWDSWYYAAVSVIRNRPYLEDVAYEFRAELNTVNSVIRGKFILFFEKQI